MPWKFAKVLCKVLSACCLINRGIHWLLHGILQPEILHLIEQAHWDLEDHHIKEYIAKGSWLSTTFHNYWRLQGLKIHEEALLKVVSEASPLKMSWRSCSHVPRREVNNPLIYISRLLKLFQESLAGTPGADQICTLVLSNLCLALTNYLNSN